MAFVIADRVRETTTTTGTGSVTLAGAYTSFQSFSAAIGNGNSTYYTISNPTTNEWEVGIGTYTSGTNSLSRTTVLASSNAGSLVSFSAGTKDVFVTQPAERSLLVQSAGSGLFAGNAAFTANGLLYANATTTVTTGSALTFDGTNLKIGNPTYAPNTNLSGNLLQIKSSSGFSYLTMGNGDGANNNTYIGSASSITTFGTVTDAGATTELMRLTSTGLGIGTSSPGVKLDVSGVGRFTGNADVLTLKYALNGGSALLAWKNEAGTTLWDIGGGIVGSQDELAIRRQGTMVALFNSSGNLGLGVTPSAWSVYKAYQVGRGSLINASTETDLVHNAFWNGTNWIYIANDFASRHLQINGQHRFFTASSGTAGNVITFTQAMTLDAIGMGVGTTTPLAKLDVNGTSLLRNTQYTYQPTPTSLTGTQTLTAAQLLTGILINTAGTGNWTMPTGTAIETGIFASLPVDSAIRFVVISTGGGGPTIATNTGVTLVGVMNVATASSATFILRKTATNTYTLYRA